MKQTKLLRLVTAAVFAALTCVATMIVNIPIPATKGYVNMGDCIVLLGAFFLGPVYGMAAGALGSMLSDVFLGYAQYAPGTLVIKGLMALLAAVLFLALRKKIRTTSLLPAIVSAFAGEIWMVTGYFAYESLLLGYGLAAAASVPANLLQAAGGLVLSALLFRALCAVPAIRRMTERKES